MLTHMKEELMMLEQVIMTSRSDYQDKVQICIQIAATQEVDNSETVIIVAVIINSCWQDKTINSI